MAAMDTSLALLGILRADTTHGYDLKHHYDRWFGIDKPLAFGQVYATLARLLKNGLIELIGDQAGEGPDRKLYAITPDGAERVNEWLRTPEVPSESMQSNLFARTVIALLLGEPAAPLLDAQRAEHMARMRELTQRKRAADFATTLLCDHALFHIEADLRWIDLTLARLDELRAQVVGS